MYIHTHKISNTTACRTTLSRSVVVGIYKYKKKEQDIPNKVESNRYLERGAVWQDKNSTDEEGCFDFRKETVFLGDVVNSLKAAFAHSSPPLRD